MGNVPEHPMIRLGGMRHVLGMETRHVAGNAGAIGRLLLLFRFRKRALAYAMTFQTPFAVVDVAFGFRGERMCIMAGNASQFLTTRLITLALVHLFNLADGMGVSAFIGAFAH